MVKAVAKAIAESIRYFISSHHHRLLIFTRSVSRARDKKIQILQSTWIPDTKKVTNESQIEYTGYVNATTSSTIPSVFHPLRYSFFLFFLFLVFFSVFAQNFSCTFRYFINIILCEIDQKFKTKKSAQTAFFTFFKLLVNFVHFLRAFVFLTFG